jgi:sec-independent protein translocase protein TatA
MHTLSFLQNLNGWEVFLIFLAFLILFGAKRLPDLAKGLGRSIREFRKAATEVEESVTEAIHSEPKPTSIPQPQVETKKNEPHL